MTISSTTRIAGPFIGNGTASAFPFTFKVFAATDLDVIKLTVSTGTESTLVLTTDYTVTLNGDQNSNPGGTVTLTAGALASGFTLTITSDIANLQPTDLTNQGGFYPEVITDSLDRATIQIQQIADIGDRTLKIPISDGTLNMELPTATERANSFLSFDANGLPSVVTAGSSGAPATITRQVFSGTGSQTVFTLASDPGALGNSAQVYIGGVYQQRSTYTIAGTTLTFSQAPVAGTDNIEFVNFLTSSIGATSADLVTYTPAGVGAVARSAASKFGDVVNVKDFGAVGDGVTDDSIAVSSAIAHLFATDKNTLFFPDGTYHFANPVVIAFASVSNRGLRLVGTSMPGFVGTRPGGTKITGASGIEALFIFTKVNPATIGGYSFECANIDFNGNSFGVGSAIVNKVGGGPMRLFNVSSCNFVGFQKAILSDISATGFTTGICQVNITGCSFYANQYGLYGKGQSAIMDLRFVGNVCEQNALGGIHTEALALGGTFEISDNLLEGQPDALRLLCGRVGGSIKRNYFESNTGSLIFYQSSVSVSVLEVGNNFVLNCANQLVQLSGGIIYVTDPYEVNGVRLNVTNTALDSKINNQAILYPATWSQTTVLDIESVILAAGIPPTSIDSGTYINFGPNIEATPIGEVSYESVNGNGSLKSTAATLATGDAIVATCLARVVSGTPTVSLYVYDSSSNYLNNSTTVGISQQVGEWCVVSATVKVPSSSVGSAIVRWVTASGVADFTKTYTYKIPSPTNSATRMYMYLPYVSPLFGSATYDPPNLVDGAGDTTTVTVTGASLGDFVEGISFSNNLQGITVTGWVSSANTVSVRFQNESGSTLDLASGTLRVKVRKT